MRSFRKIHVVFVISVLAAAGLAFAVRQARIQGTVTDTQGNPIPNAVITITGDPTRESIDLNKVVAVDKEGTFTALIVDATQYYIFHVTAEGYQPQERPFKVGGGTTPHRSGPSRSAAARRPSTASSTPSLSPSARPSTSSISSS